MATISAKSLSGTIEFDGEHVVLAAKGKQQTIPLASIVSVVFKPCGLAAGYLSLETADVAAVAGAFGASRKAGQRRGDGSALIIQWSRKSLNDDFQAVADAINAALLT